MKEKLFINLISKITNSKYIGDDCAYLRDLNIVVTQDNLVEDVHFSKNFITPYQLGYKAVMVNISDVCASGAKPEYLTIALSLPNNIDETYIEDFYTGAKEAAKDVKIVGGDITGANKIFISVTALGSTKGRTISSRCHAQVGQKIVVAGNHGSSAAGLRLLMGKKFPKLLDIEKKELVKAHLMPHAQISFSKKIATYEKSPYAMMDTSDGLADALITIAQASNVMLEVDFDKIPHAKALDKIDNYENLILFGGEDYGLISTVWNCANLTVIGEVKSGFGVKINYKNSSKILSAKDVENNVFNHFEE